jgi:hypothetical protein
VAGDALQGRVGVLVSAVVLVGVVLVVVFLREEGVVVLFLLSLELAVPWSLPGLW